MKKSKKQFHFFSFMILVTLLILVSCQKSDERPEPEVRSSLKNIIYAGVRSSSYGIEPFPEPQGWEKAMQTMTGYFEGSTPCAIWIVGKFERNKACHLFFPSDGKTYTNIEFDDVDTHERYLSHFDDLGIKVFLQVEPASADMPTLIDLVLNRYKHHACVIGFGVDVEWHRESENPEWGVAITDQQAEEWEKKVKAHNPQYKLFLKHWDRTWMPENYRGDIVFVDDSQILPDFDAMLDEFVDYWSAYFYPNMVFFQIGYPSDKPWWQKLATPPSDIGRAIAARIKQDCGIFWVDFTLRDVLPTE
jgi:hypothetical protein